MASHAGHSIQANGGEGKPGDRPASARFERLSAPPLIWNH